MLGFGKWFVIFLILGWAIWYGTGNTTLALQVVLAFIVVKIGWKFLTGK